MATLTYSKVFYSSYMVYQTLKSAKLGGRSRAIHAAVRNFFVLLSVKFKGGN